MNAVFADTFCWAALTNIDDPANVRDLSISRSLAPEKIVTTDEVLSEYLTFFAGARSSIRDRAGRNVVALLESSEVRIVPQSRETLLSGVQLYRARPDKGYSLIDCISMQTMRREGLTDVLTNDKHFQQEGFRTLLREES